MEVNQSKLTGVLTIKPPTIFEDFRGTYVELYNEQLEESRSAIKKLEEEGQSLKQNASIVSLDDQIKLKLQELTVLTTSLNQLRGEKTEITRKIATLKDQIGDQPSEVLNAKATRPNPRIDQFSAKLWELEAERAKQLLISK